MRDESGPVPASRVQSVAEALDFITSDELRALTGITPSTEEAWCRRGTGPAYVLVGNERLYPRSQLREFLHAKVRDRSQRNVKALL